MVKNDILNKSLDLINELINQKNYKKALELTNEIEKKFTNSHEVFSMKGIIQSYLYNFDDALENFLKAKDLKCSIKTYKINMAGYYAKRGNYHYNNEDYEEALKEFLKVLDFSLNRTEVSFSNIGNTLLKLNKTDEAIKYYKKSLKSLPSYSVALSNLANLYIELNDFNSALPYAKKCYDLDPRIPFYVSSYGKVLEGLGDIPKAEEIFYKLLMIAPSSHNTYYMIGSFLNRIKDNTKIISLFTSEIKIIESHSMLLNILGEAYINIGKIDEAVQYLLKGLELNNENYEINLSLGKAYKLLDNEECSKKFIKKSKELLKLANE